MADEAIGESFSVSEQNVPVSSSYEEPKTTSERVFTQDEVGRLIGKTKAEVREKVRSEYEAQRNQNQQQSTFGGIVKPNDDYIRSQVEAEVQRVASEMQNSAMKKAQEEQANQVINQFVDRISGASEKYNDFEQRVSELNLEHVPNLLPLSISVDNTADVMYELANNPGKAYQINEIANKNPQMAYKMIQQLSSSIKQNEEALSARRPNEPLSQLKTSRTATDSGTLSVSDYRKMPFLRG